jgi:hypothetical protein
MFVIMLILFVLRASLLGHLNIISFEAYSLGYSFEAYYFGDPSRLRHHLVLWPRKSKVVFLALFSPLKLPFDNFSRIFTN